MHCASRFIFLVVFLFVSFAASSSRLGSDLPLGREEFLEMCEPIVVQDSLDAVKQSICFIYFIGMRDGYLRGMKDGVARAEVYIFHEGKVSPGAELDYGYLAKMRDYQESDVARKLMEHELNCMSKVDSVALLKEFTEYVRNRSKKWGISVFFQEFAARNYTGACWDVDSKGYLVRSKLNS